MRAGSLPSGANALVAVLARDAADLGDLPNHPGWVSIRPDGVSAWTDDYSNVIGALLRQKLFFRYYPNKVTLATPTLAGCGSP